MDVSIKLKDLGLLMSCLALLEHEVSKFFFKISEKLAGYVSIAISHVALESKNHGEILKRISKGLIATEEINEEICREVCGTSWENIMNVLRTSIKDLEGITSKDIKQIISLLEKNLDFESFTNEEMYVGSLLPLISSVIKQKKIPQLELVTLIIEEIAEEEKFHLEILKKVVDELKSLYLTS